MQTHMNSGSYERMHATQHVGQAGMAVATPRPNHLSPPTNPTPQPTLAASACCSNHCGLTHVDNIYDRNISNVNQSSMVVATLCWLQQRIFPLPLPCDPRGSLLALAPGGCDPGGLGRAATRGVAEPCAAGKGLARGVAFRRCCSPIFLLSWIERALIFSIFGEREEVSLL